MNCRVFSLILCIVIALPVAFSIGQESETQDPPAAIPGLQPKQVVDAPDSATLLQKSSYIIGFNTTARLISELKTQGVEVDKAKFMEGIEKALNEEKIGMTREEITSVMMAFQKVVEKELIEKRTAAAKKNKAEGDAYLAENAKNEKVKQLPSGVQYEVVQAGTGRNPGLDDRVKVHYHGTLPDGTVFDSTMDPQDGSLPMPAEFDVARVVPGFSAAIQAMKVGGKWNIVIPGEQAYGIRGREGIGPNQTLCFQVQLVEILK